MRIAGTQKAALEVAKLVEEKQRMIAGAGKMPVVGSGFLRAIGGARRSKPNLNGGSRFSPFAFAIPAPPCRLYHAE
jgi:hypothetical protein